MMAASAGLHIVELYSRHLAINGDMGNTLVLAERARLAGIDTRVTRYNPGDAVPEDVDLVTMGSGPVSALRAIADDVAGIAATVRAWVDAGVPALFVGAGFQLAGTGITGIGEHTLTGLGVFEQVTDASAPRQVTASFIVSTGLGRLVGIENHGSVTTLAPGQRPFGTALSGRGNGAGHDEGALRNEAVGTHLHGPVLAMNPVLADHLLGVAADARGLRYVTTAQHERLDALAASTRLLLDEQGGTVAARARA